MTSNIFLAPYVRSFFEDHLTCRRNLSHNTIHSYRDALKLLLLFAAQLVKKPVTKLLVIHVTETIVVNFLAELERTRGNAIQTRNCRLAAIRSLFEYIAAREPLLLDHCHKITTIPRKRGALLPPIQYLQKDEINAILNAAASHGDQRQRDHALLLFMYNTGARVQEAADTRVSWLSLRPPYKAELLGKGRKWRTCPLWENTATHLRQLIDRRHSTSLDDHVFINRFGHQFSRYGIGDILDRSVAQAAETLPSLHDRHVTPHTLRHTTAMHLLQSGVEINVIRSWLGHVSLATTNRYIEIDLAMKAKALETCEVKNGTVPEASWKAAPDILKWLESL